MVKQMKRCFAFALSSVLVMSSLSAVSAEESRAIWPWQRTEAETESETPAETTEMAESEAPEETEGESYSWLEAVTTESDEGTPEIETSYSELADGTLQLDKVTVQKGTAETFRVPDRVAQTEVTAIGPWAFTDARIGQVYLPYTVETIDETAFAGAWIKSFKASPDSPFAVIDDVLFEKKTKTLVAYPVSREDSQYIVPEGIRAVRAFAFYGACALENIDLPETVRKIGNNAFMNCVSLQRISVPERVKVLESCTFSNCSGLTEAFLPEDLKQIRGNAFFACSGLEYLSIPASVKSIGADAFFGCENLILKVERGSAAALYARDNDLEYEYPDPYAWLWESEEETEESWWYWETEEETEEETKTETETETETKTEEETEEETEDCRETEEESEEYWQTEEETDEFWWLWETEEESEDYRETEEETEDYWETEEETEEPETMPVNRFDLSTVTPGVLTVVTSPDFPPYEYWAEDSYGDEYLAGFDIALAEYIADYLGLELRFTTTDFEGVFIKIQVGSADLGISGISGNSDRGRLVDFSDIYYSDEQTFVCRREDESLFSSPGDINYSYLKIGVQEWSVQEDLAGFYSPNADILYYESFADGLELLLNGRIDGMYVDREIAKSFVARRYANELAIAFEIPNMYSEGTVACVGKGNAELLARVNEAIHAAIEDGSMSDYIARAVALAAGEDVASEEGWAFWQEQFPPAEE